MSYVHSTQADERTMWNLFFQAIQAQSASEADDLTKLFRHYDADGSGRLEADELGMLVKHMAIVTNQWLDKSQVNHEVQLILGKSDPSPTGRGFTGVSVEGFRAYASDKQQMMTELIRYCKHAKKEKSLRHANMQTPCNGLVASSHACVSTLAVCLWAWSAQ